MFWINLYSEFYYFANSCWSYFYVQTVRCDCVVILSIY
nr:MAG TPA_asm: hypothetical protein [Bacteriophage sp.]